MSRRNEAREDEIHGYRVSWRQVEEMVEEHVHVIRAIAQKSVRRGRDFLRISLLLAETGRSEWDGIWAHIHERMSAHAVPDELADLCSLPMAPDGWVDRSMIDDSLIRDVRSANRAIEPAPQLEQEVLAIWQAALGEPDTGPTDDFFVSGGTSLAAIKVLEQIRNRFDANVSLIDICRAPTARELAGVLAYRLATPGDGTDCC